MHTALYIRIEDKTQEPALVRYLLRTIHGTKRKHQTQNTIDMSYADVEIDPPTVPHHVLHLQEQVTAMDTSRMHAGLSNDRKNHHPSNNNAERSSKSR